MQSANLNEKQHTSKNRSMLYFFLNLLILVSAWFVFYNLILKPGRIIDRPLTNFITASVAKCINLFSSATAPILWRDDSLNGARAFLTKGGNDIFGIYDVCNGIDLMFIYVGIIMLLPYAFKRKLFFSLAGILIIILGNIIRVLSLYYIFLYYRAAFDFSHHYVFTILMYILIFYGWLLFIKKDKANEQSN